MFTGLSAFPHTPLDEVFGLFEDVTAGLSVPLRGQVPGTVSVGVSGDGVAATGLSAGCDGWYSVIGGTLPAPALSWSVEKAEPVPSR